MTDADHAQVNTPEHLIEHPLRSSVLLKDLHIVDARWMSNKMDFNTLMEKIQQPQENPARVIVFLTCTDSEALLKEGAHKHSKQTKKRNSTTFWVAYNLSSHGMTTMA